MTQKFYYHNELYCRVPRPIKRRFMELAEEKKVEPNDLLNLIIKRYVFDNTPHDPLSQKIYDLKNWFNNSRAQLYNLYSAIMLMMIGIVLVILMQKFNQSLLFVALFFIFVVMILGFAKLFFILGKKEKEMQ